MLDASSDVPVAELDSQLDSRRAQTRLAAAGRHCGAARPRKWLDEQPRKGTRRFGPVSKRIDCQKLIALSRAELEQKCAAGLRDVDDSDDR
jgi:hypothetical protein